MVSQYIVTKNNFKKDIATLKNKIEDLMRRMPISKERIPANITTMKSECGTSHRMPMSLTIYEKHRKIG